MNKDFDKHFYSDDINVIVGCDEAGRGPLAGPVVAAAVILKKDFYSELIDDSKKLTSKQREKAFKVIKENAIDCQIGIIDAPTIDKINIYEASRQAMLQAINKLTYKFDLVLTDAMPLKCSNINCIDIIKGDSKSLSISAASIVAKVTRDKLMDDLDKLYPNYGFKKHKGYGTKTHLEALKKYGPIKNVHRFTYKPIKQLIDPIFKLF